MKKIKHEHFEVTIAQCLVKSMGNCLRQILRRFLISLCEWIDDVDFCLICLLKNGV